MDVSLRDMIYKTFAKMPVKQRMAMKAEQLVPEVKSKPIEVETSKGVGDISISLEAQRIFNPGMPPAPPKPPNASQADTGVAPSMDLSSKWDKGNG